MYRYNTIQYILFVAIISGIGIQWLPQKIGVHNLSQPTRRADADQVHIQIGYRKFATGGFKE